MALITTGKPFIRALEATGTLGVYIPLEGGHEGRYQRRLRTAGYELLTLSSRGLGDPSAYLTQVHGVRPPHLGKKTTARDAAVGYVYYTAPIATYPLESLAPHKKGLVLWLLEGSILSTQELQYLVTLPTLEPRIKVVIEMGGGRVFSWKPLQEILAA